MRHSAVLGRHARPPKVPLRSWAIVAMALAALAVTLAWVTAGSPATAATTVKAAPASLDRGAVNQAAGFTAIDTRAAVARVAAQAHARAAAVLAAHTYTVRAGDSLSSVAARRCGQERFWTGTYAASRARGWTAKNANVLSVGQHLYLSCTYDARQLRYAPPPPPPPPPPVLAVAAVATARTGGTARVYHPVYASSYHGVSGSYQSCVIARESGGRANAVNPSSGAGGLYQFLPSTWHSLGHNGLPQNASVAEQNAAFQQAYAQSGTSPWSPYDGC